MTSCTEKSLAGDAAAEGFPFKAVIFDMDGVLVDTEMAYIDEVHDFLAAHGIENDRHVYFDMVGRSHSHFQQTLVRWLATVDIHVGPQEAEDRYDVWSADRKLDYAKLLNPGVSEALTGLRARGVRLALASSSSLANIMEVLGQCGISDAFEFVTSGEQFHESKPNPEIYLYTMERLGLTAGECCCVEDSAPGIAAGKAAGLTVFAKREERFDFSQDAADHMIDQVSDILRL